MKKIIVSLLMISVLISSVIMSVRASEITDDIMITKTLADGTKVSVHSNPYIGEGMTELEYSLIEKMRQTATEIGIDVRTDVSYQNYEQRMYRSLEYFARVPLNAEQVDGVENIIDECGRMLVEKMSGKVPAEGTISEGFYTGATEAERDAIRKEVFTDYADKAIKALGIYNIDTGFEAYRSDYQFRNYIMFNCNKDVVAEGNYLIENYSNISEEKKAILEDYFKDGLFSVTEIKTYPQSVSMNYEITAGIYHYDNIYSINDADKVYQVCLLKNNGEVEVLNMRTEGENAYFEIDECGYIAWGIPKEESGTPTQNPKNTETPEVTETPAPSPGNIGNNSGKTTAPKTTDGNNIILFSMLVFAAGSVLISLKNKCRA